MAILYEDPRIVCDSDGITVHWYYFPLGDKRLLYSDIRAVKEHEMGVFTGKWRIWGGDVRHWFHLDGHRPDKEIAFILDVGGFVRPVLTPDDPGKFRSVLEERGISVAPPPYEAGSTKRRRQLRSASSVG
jgi:hypothetical protein